MGFHLQALIVGAGWGFSCAMEECTTDVCAANAARKPHPSFSRLGVPTLRDPPLIRDRNSLPDSHMPWMLKVCGGPKTNFPAVFGYSGSKDVKVAGADLAVLLDDELPGFGAIVVKGLPLTSPDTYSVLMHSTNMTLVDYIGGVTSRPTVAAKVTPASTEPEWISMEPHMDNPYWPVPPARLMLYVGKPPKSGGQALITDTRATLRQLREESSAVVEEFVRRLVRYEHFYPDEGAAIGGIPSWQQSLAKGCTVDEGCNATQVAEANMREKKFGWEWIGGGLKRWEIIPAVIRHPVTGEETWSNMMTAMHCSVFDNHPEYPELNRPPEDRNEPCTMHGQMPYHTTFGDGATIPTEYMHAIRGAQWKNSVSFDYAAGDVLAIDNYHAMHGRFSFEPPRELFLTMVGR